MSWSVLTTVLLVVVVAGWITTLWWYCRAAARAKARWDGGTPNPGSGCCHEGSHYPRRTAGKPDPR